ncbi:MAG: sugar ABC transporter ATP-binding protein, partial [Clostridiaceae bacterium]|nr:sugar ABC transporter ATP-binding protein [Clostridiaceae bacterium]
MSENILLEVKGIDKSFGATKALNGMSFQLLKGEVHAIVGENGAGKSTLMNIIAGIFAPDSGEIYIEGKRVEIKNPHEAEKHGIGFVHQEIALCPDVSVAENIFMSEINKNKRFTVNYKKLYDRASKILKPLANINPRKLVADLSISNQQVVEIAKALSMNCKIIIFDEPTAALSEKEAESLFKIIRELKSNGIGIIYISHRMAEVFSLCDRVTVMRDGRLIDTKNINETDSKEIVNLMVGREIGDIYPPKRDSSTCSKETIFEIREFSDGKRFQNISFDLKEGEILGLAGLVGAGRSEVAQSVCALNSKISGEVYYQGSRIDIKSPGESIKHGIVYLTEDRKSAGLFLDLSIKWNISAMKLLNVSKKGLIQNHLETNQCDTFIRELGIKCSGMNQNLSSLSGGNQQKVLLAKLLTVKPRIVFMDEPT